MYTVCSNGAFANPKQGGDIAGKRHFLTTKSCVFLDYALWVFAEWCLFFAAGERGNPKVEGWKFSSGPCMVGTVEHLILGVSFMISWGWRNFRRRFRRHLCLIQT